MSDVTTIVLLAALAMFFANALVPRTARGWRRLFAGSAPLAIGIFWLWIFGVTFQAPIEGRALALLDAAARYAALATGLAWTAMMLYRGGQVVSGRSEGWRSYRS